MKAIGREKKFVTFGCALDKPIYNITVSILGQPMVESFKSIKQTVVQNIAVSSAFSDFYFNLAL
jgi:hypothetical protein